MKNILLEGRPGIGKTTLIRAAAAQLAPLRIGGFYTSEIREPEGRVGFRIETFDGQAGILAHVKIGGALRIGEYGVDVAALERVGVNGLQRALHEADIIILDEIGKMEVCSCRFQEVLTNCLNSAKPVLATIYFKSYPFVDQVKARPDVRRMKITHENRESLLSQLVQDCRDLMMKKG